MDTIEELLAQSATSPAAARRLKEKEALAALIAGPTSPTAETQNATAEAAGADVGEAIRRQIEEAKKRRLARPGATTVDLQPDYTNPSSNYNV